MENKNISLNNKMVFSVLADILKNSTQPNTIKDVPSLLKNVKVESMDMSKIHDIKKKLLDNHILINDKHLNNIFSILNVLNDDFVKNKTTVDVILDAIVTSVRESIKDKFNTLTYFDEMVKPLLNKKNGKNIEYFKTAIQQRYKLREIVIYSLFPMIYYLDTKNIAITSKQLDELKALAIANGFSTQNLVKVKQELQNVGYGTPIKSLEEKLNSGLFLHKIGTTVEIVSPNEELGMGFEADAFKKVVNKVMEKQKLDKNVLSSSEVTNVVEKISKKTGEKFIDNIGQQFGEKIKEKHEEKKETNNLSDFFDVLNKNKELVIIMEMLDMIRHNILSNHKNSKSSN